MQPNFHPTTVHSSTSSATSSLQAALQKNRRCIKTPELVIVHSKHLCHSSTILYRLFHQVAQGSEGIGRLHACGTCPHVSTITCEIPCMLLFKGVVRHSYPNWWLLGCNLGGRCPFLVPSGFILSVIWTVLVKSWCHQGCFFPVPSGWLLLLASSIWLVAVNSWSVLVNSWWHLDG